VPTPRVRVNAPRRLFGLLPLVCVAASPTVRAEPAFSLAAFQLVAGQASAAAASPELSEPVTHIEADRIDGRENVNMRAEGNVRMDRAETTLNADRVDYDLLEDEVTAEGSVVVRRGTDTISGPRLRMKVEEKTGEMETPHYTLERSRALGGTSTPMKGHGDADVLLLEGENRYKLKNATFTTCDANDPAWYLKARELDLDFSRADGDSRNATFHFGGVPIFYTPAATFPLSGDRRSGLLAPTFSPSNVTGFDVTIPYYFNLAPNYDDTFVPRYMTKRGLQLNNEFRYLFPNINGTLRTEWLPEDHERGESRSAIAFNHQQTFNYGFSGLVNYNAVSDKDYFTDLSSRVTQTSTDNLVREAALNYNAGSWLTGSVLAQRFQTISGPLQYNRLPQISLQAYVPELNGFSFRMPVEGAYFQRDGSDEGWRTYSYPQAQYNFVRPAGFVTPKIGLHTVSYSMDARVSPGPESATRSVPVMSVDSGLYFDRDVQIKGRDYYQTLEPRLYYLNVPYRYQDDLPVFDTGVADFGFAQIFSDNLFVGQDRFANANQLTAAVSSRLVNANTGAELLRGAVGTRYYFTDQRVTLPGETARTGRIADYLVAFAGRVLPNTTVDVFGQYNPRDSELEQATASIRYQPAFASVLSASYRYKRQQYTDVDLTAQWPIYGGIYGVARVNGDIETKKLTEGIAGFEYNGSCWVLRLAAHRLLNTSGFYTNAYYLQVEFGGLISVGNSPVALLQRSVTGYGRINHPISDPAFGQE